MQFLFQQLGWIASGCSIKLDKTVVILLTKAEEFVFDKANFGDLKVCPNGFDRLDKTVVILVTKAEEFDVVFDRVNFGVSRVYPNDVVDNLRFPSVHQVL